MKQPKGDAYSRRMPRIHPRETDSTVERSEGDVFGLETVSLSTSRGHSDCGMPRKGTRETCDTRDVLPQT